MCDRERKPDGPSSNDTGVDEHDEAPMVGAATGVMLPPPQPLLLLSLLLLLFLFFLPPPASCTRRDDSKSGDAITSGSIISKLESALPGVFTFILVPVRGAIGDGGDMLLLRALLRADCSVELFRCRLPVIEEEE